MALRFNSPTSKAGLILKGSSKLSTVSTGAVVLSFSAVYAVVCS